MVSEIRVYVEGGGRDKHGKTSIRKGFHGFLENVIERIRAKKVRFSIVACGGREEAIADFRKALASHADSFNILLVDSEGPVSESSDDAGSVTDENHHFMVQLMEAWFLADVEALKGFYERDFNANAIPHNPKVEEIDKDRILSGLNEATKRTSKGEYHKVRHGPGILERLDASRVRKAAPHCERLFSTLEKIVG
jgi:hypothetical protein